MTPTRTPSLSIIIPVGPGEESWQTLLSRLKARGRESVEIVVVCADAEGASRVRARFGELVRVVASSPGRARQLNAGARIASGDFLWFVHADSEMTERVLTSMTAFTRTSPDALGYCNLYFDGPRRMLLNAVGVWLRSHLLGIPFGDQGLLMSREIFERLGGYPEEVAFGEDHLLVWRAHQAGVPVRCTGAWLGTSARKYVENGWASTTLRTLWLTAKQALPEVRQRYRGPS